jgi:PAS domain S-box-containing protein
MKSTVKVLHVDDDSLFTDVAAELLKREDDRIEMVCETNVSDALHRLEKDQIDCIVSDYDMPGRNGIEFLETVRERYTKLPFILFTGKGSEEVASEAISAGVSEYLQKESATEQYMILGNRITNAVEKYRTERELSETNQALQTILDNRPAILYTTDEEGTVTRARGKALEQIGAGGNDAIGTSVFEAFEHRPEIIDHFERALDGEFVGGIAEVRDTTFQSWYQPLRNDDGDVIGVVGLSIDVSERERRKRQLEWQTNVLEAAPVGVVMADPTQEDNPIVFANEQFKTLTGYEMDEILGRNCRFLQGDETDPERVARLREAIAAKEPVTVELRNYRKDGTLFWNEVSIGHTQLEEHGEERYIGFQRDITERKNRRRNSNE